MLGPYGTAESRKRYHQLIADWEAGGRRPLHLSPEEIRPRLIAAPLTVAELCDAFYLYADEYYRKNGKPTGEAATFKIATKVLCDAFGDLPAAKFGPTKLEEVRGRMIKRGWIRKSINTQVRRLRHVFKWGVSNELVPATVHVALTTIKALKRGRSAATEGKKKKPVPDAFIDALKPHLPVTVWAMIQLQRMTGMRSDEMTVLRACDLDCSGPEWEYTPVSHKTEHHDEDHVTRVFCFGKRCQAILSPFLTRPVNAYLFDPREAVAASRVAIAKGNGRRPGQRQDARKTSRLVRDHYDTASYRRAIHNACDKATKAGPITVPRWRPHRLRHTFGTLVRKHFGAERAQIALGHKNLDSTLIYAERDVALLRAIAAQIG